MGKKGEVREYPILFKKEMREAILAGKKTETRRLRLAAFLVAFALTPLAYFVLEITKICLKFRGTEKLFRR